MKNPLSYLKNLFLHRPLLFWSLLFLFSFGALWASIFVPFLHRNWIFAVSMSAVSISFIPMVFLAVRQHAENLAVEEHFKKHGYKVEELAGGSVKRFSTGDRE